MLDIIQNVNYFLAFDSDSEQDLSLSSTIPDDSGNQKQIIVQNQQSNLSFSIHVDRGKVAFFPTMKVRAAQSKKLFH